MAKRFLNDVKFEGDVEFSKTPTGLGGAIQTELHASTAVTPVDADEFFFCDASDSFNKKKVTGADLKTYIGSGSGDVTKDALAGGTVVTSIADGEYIPLSVAGTPNSIKIILYSAFKTLMNAIYATLSSPTFTGTPAAPTAAADTNTTQLATTAFYCGQIGTATPLANGTGAAGTSKKFSPIDHVHPSSTPTIATPTDISGDTTITIGADGEQWFTISKGSACAIDLPDPASGDNGKVLRFMSTNTYLHYVRWNNAIAFNNTNSNSYKRATQPAQGGAKRNMTTVRIIGQKYYIFDSESYVTFGTY